MIKHGVENEFGGREPFLTGGNRRPQERRRRLDFGIVPDWAGHARPPATTRLRSLADARKPGTLRRYSGSERNYRIMLDSSENPYTTAPGTVYNWGRSRVLGGRTLHWARASDRMAEYEFKAASRDG